MEADIKNINTEKAGPLFKIYSEFATESKQELFDSKEHIYNFFSKDENYKKLLNSEFGDNLLRKYSAKVVATGLNEVIDFSIDKIIELITIKSINSDDNKNIINSTRLWLKNLFIFDGISDWEKEKNNEPVITLDYDIPDWFNSYSKSIYNFKKKSTYQMKFSKQNQKIINEIINLYGNDDINFAIGKTFHELPIGLNEIMKSSVKIANN